LAKAQSMTRRPSRKELRQIADRRRRNQTWLVGGLGAVIVILVALTVYSNIRRQMPVGDEQVLPTQGNVHIEEGRPSPIAYNSTPPTSGPHYSGLAPWGIHTTPIRYEQVVHNMEDGGVIVYYQCEEACPELQQQLAEVVAPYVDAGRHVVLMPNDPAWTINNSQPLHQDMDARIALTAWQRLDKFDEFDAQRIRSFIDRYEGIDNHVR
jgi:hypothetical protein